jgi:hypothetical protein
MNIITQASTVNIEKIITPEKVPDWEKKRMMNMFINTHPRIGDPHPIKYIILKQLTE